MFHAALLLAAFACLQGSSIAQENVLILLADDIGVDYVGCYGEGPAAANTPNIDALAARGVRYADVMSAATWTLPSHVSLLSSLHATEHGVQAMERVPAELVSLPKVLREQGYETIAVTEGIFVTPRFGLDQGFAHFDSFDGKARIDETGKTTWDVKNLQRRSDETVDRTLAWVAEQDDPFFLWVHLWDPHDPTLVPPSEFVAGVPQNDQGAYHPIRLYAREVEYLDLQIGRLLEGLRAAAGDRVCDRRPRHRGRT